MSSHEPHHMSLMTLSEDHNVTLTFPAGSVKANAENYIVNSFLLIDGLALTYHSKW